MIDAAKGRIAPDVRLFLFREPPPGSATPPIVALVLAPLGEGGFTVVETLEQYPGGSRVGGVVAGKDSTRVDGRIRRRSDRNARFGPAR
jgi:hypothetical protein